MVTLPLLIPIAVARGDSSFDYPAEDIAKWNERNRVLFERVQRQETLP